MDSKVPSIPRTVAAALAVGGSCWGAFLLLMAGPRVLSHGPCAAGYLVTVGYLVRAASAPPFGVRLLIWAASIGVQGWWLCDIAIPDAGRTGPNLMNVWWTFATVCSVIAVVTERRSAERDAG